MMRNFFNACFFSSSCSYLNANLSRFAENSARYGVFNIASVTTTGANGKLAVGFWLAAGLFCFCFLFIHLLRWAMAYLRQFKRNLPEKRAEKQIENSSRLQQSAKQTTEKTNRTAEKPPEKIYYIVEKKKKRESSKYSEPKEFRFK